MMSKINNFTIVTPLHSYDKNLLNTGLSIQNSLVHANKKNIRWIIKSSNAVNEQCKANLIYQCKNLNISFIEKKDNSMYEALTEAINISDDGYIVWINSGDLFFKEGFLNLVDLIKTNEFDICIFNKSVKFLDNRIYTTSRKFFILFVRKGYYGFYGESLPQENIVFKRNTFLKINHNNIKKFKLAGDWYIFKEIFSLTDNILQVKKNFAQFVFCENQLSEDKKSYLNEITLFSKLKYSLFWKIIFILEKYIARI